MIKNNRIKYLSLFTGIGGFDLPLRELGFECVGWSEIDKYAIKTFEANFPELKGKNIGDITKYDFTNITNIDLIVGGSSCQSFSISSNNRIGLDGVSGVFYDYIRALKTIQPSWFIWENVKGVLSSNKGKDWKIITNSFNDAGYNFHYQVLNSADYGIPQQRKRVFVVGQRKDLGAFNFTFPPKQELKIFLKDIIVKGYTDRDVSYTIDANYYKASESNPRAYFEDSKRQIVFNYPVRVGQFGKGGQGERVNSLTGTSVCLAANSGGRGAGLYEVPVMFTEKRTEEAKQIRRKNMKNGRDFSPRRGKELVLRDDGLENCITTGKSQESLLYNGSIIRKLYTIECFRLQDFPDEFHNKAKEAGVSNTQLYKQAGNAVTVNVIRCILNSLFNGLNKTQLNLF